MTTNKIKLIFSLIGGAALICLHFLGLTLFYVTGFFVPVIYLITIFFAMNFAKRKNKNVLTFAELFKICLTVTWGITFINFMFLIVDKLIVSSIQEFCLVFILNLLIGILFSTFSAYVFIKIFEKESNK
jgi:hypothetical protein